VFDQSPDDPGRIFAGNIRAPHMDELTISSKAQITDKFAVQGSIVLKDFKNLLVNSIYYEPYENNTALLRYHKLEMDRNAYRKYRGLLISAAYNDGPLSLILNYAYSKTTGNVDEDWGLINNWSGGYNYLNRGVFRPKYNAGNQEGRLANDVPHNLNLYASMRNNFGKLSISNGIKFQFISGTPYRQASYRNVPLSEAEDQLTAAGLDPMLVYTISPADFVILAAPDGSSRDGGRYNSTWKLDYSLNASYKLLKKIDFIGRMDVFNILNHQMRRTYNTALVWNESTASLSPSPDFGKSNGVSYYIEPRTILVSLGCRF